MDDLISRQAAIDALHMHLMYRMGTDSNKKRLDEWINNLPSAQTDVPDINDGDMISRRAVQEMIDRIGGMYPYRQIGNRDSYSQYNEAWTDAINRVDAELNSLPSAQPDLSEAYSKAVFTWLTNYQIRAAELKGRYTPYEVLSWVINDWRKENG